MSKYNIVEIFNSIQGEGEHMGKPVTFVRLHGCNLSCSFCDEPLHKGPNYTEMTAEEIIEKCTLPAVVITGGEPSLHNINPLIKKIRAEDKFVAVETNGYKIENIKAAHWLTLSPKGDTIPVGSWSEIKILVDLEKELPIGLINIARSKAMTWLQPINHSNTINKDNMKACIDLCIKQGLNFSPQLHKLLEIE